MTSQYAGSWGNRTMFSDAGLPSTTHTDNCIVPAAKGILAALNEMQPDAIVVEFGDGIMGHTE